MSKRGFFFASNYVFIVPHYMSVPDRGVYRHIPDETANILGTYASGSGSWDQPG
ncbi:hypothetical protein [Paenibacillus sp. NRS-1781]|uniref:hypothetical protein n=1 Tax=Paenibacillus sp. NRS-1781 TaxID=3233905 RepID=UPI003D27152E